MTGEHIRPTIPLPSREALGYQSPSTFSTTSSHSMSISNLLQNTPSSLEPFSQHSKDQNSSFVRHDPPSPNTDDLLAPVLQVSSSIVSPSIVSPSVVSPSVLSPSVVSLSVLSPSVVSPSVTPSSTALLTPPNPIRRPRGRPPGSLNRRTIANLNSPNSVFTPNPSSALVSNPPSISVPNSQPSQPLVASQSVRMTWDDDDVLYVVRLVHRDGKNWPNILQSLKNNSHRVPNCTIEQLKNMFKNINRVGSKFRAPFVPIPPPPINRNLDKTENQRLTMQHAATNGHAKGIHDEIMHLLTEINDRQVLADTAITPDMPREEQLDALRNVEANRHNIRLERMREYQEKTALDTEAKRTSIRAFAAFVRFLEREEALGDHYTSAIDSIKRSIKKSYKRKRNQRIHSSESDE